MTHFSFVHITDHHIGESETDLLRGFSPTYAMRTVMRHIATNVADRADFIVSTGDLVQMPSPAAYRTARNLLGIESENGRAPGPLPISVSGLRQFPMYFLPGNHDDRLEFVRSLFPRAGAMPLVNATFVHKGVQFICLDWGPDVKAVASAPLLEFLAAALRTELPSILLMHHHPVSIGSRWLDDFIADEVGRFWELARGRNVLGIFFGHAHTTHESVVEGIPTFGLRSTIYQFAQQAEPLMCLEPPHYRLVTVADGQISTQLFEAPL